MEKMKKEIETKYQKMGIQVKDIVFVRDNIYVVQYVRIGRDNIFFGVFGKIKEEFVFTCKSFNTFKQAKNFAFKITN